MKKSRQRHKARRKLKKARHAAAVRRELATREADFIKRWSQ